MLGPRGLMPNAKLGTIVTDVVPAIRGMKEGRGEFRCVSAPAVCALACKTTGTLMPDTDRYVHHSLAFLWTHQRRRPCEAVPRQSA